MAKSNGLNFNLPSVDDLFSTEEERAEARLEKVVNLSPTEISDFPNHPFKVRMDAAMYPKEAGNTIWLLLLSLCNQYDPDKDYSAELKAAKKE